MSWKRLADLLGTAYADTGARQGDATTPLAASPVAAEARSGLLGSSESKSIERSNQTDGDHVLAHGKVTVEGYVDVVVYNQVRFLNVVFAEDTPDWAEQAVAAMEAREEAERYAAALLATTTRGERETPPAEPADPLPAQHDRRAEGTTDGAPWPGLVVTPGPHEQFLAAADAKFTKAILGNASVAKELQAPIKELQPAPAAPSATQASGSGTTKQGLDPGVPGGAVMRECSENATRPDRR